MTHQYRDWKYWFNATNNKWYGARYANGKRISEVIKKSDEQDLLDHIEDETLRIIERVAKRTAKAKKN